MTEYSPGTLVSISYHEDGFLDLFIGLTILIFGIGILTGNAWLAGVMPAVLISTWMSGRQSLLKGRVRSKDLRAKKDGLRMTALMGIFFMTMLAGVGAFFATLLIPDWRHGWIAENFDLLLGMGGGLLIGAIGYITGNRRLYVYMVLAVVIFLISYLLSGPLWLSLVVLGGIMLLAGTSVLIRFLSEHPRKSSY